MPTRRHLFALGTALLAQGLHTPLAAQAWPSRPIRVIVPFPPGGASDILARAFFTGFEQRIGTSIVVDNRAGAAALVGTRAVADAAPDGYTLGFFDVAFAINPALREKELGYRWQGGFAPLLYVADVAQVLVASAASGFKSAADAFAALRGGARKYSFGSAGVGSGSHLAAEQLAQVMKIEYLHVPYKGGAPSNAALAGGEVDFAFATATAIRPFVDAGRAVPLAVASPRRLGLLPQVPTLAESGVQGAEASVFFGIFGPAGLPDPVLARLRQAMKDHLGDAAVRERLTRQGFEIDGRTGAEFDAFVAGEVQRWARVVREGNIRAE